MIRYLPTKILARAINSLNLLVSLDPCGKNAGQVFSQQGSFISFEFVDEDEQ